MSRALNTASADLYFFFSTGVTTFQRSTCGPMLERLEMYATREKAVGETMLVRETHDYRRDAPDITVMDRVGRVGRRLQALAAVDPQAARALAYAYGDRGALWTGHRRGRIVALFPLTESGVALVARARRQSKHPLELSDAERLRTEVEIDGITNGRDAIRRQLITRAEREAEALLERALRAWVAT